MNNNNFNSFFNNFSGQNFNRRPASPFDGLKRFFTGKSMLSKLVIINIAVFLLINLISLYFVLLAENPYHYGNDGSTVVGYWLSVPSNLNMLIKRPWTLLSYMFLHEELWHLFFNMLMLYFGGRIFIEYLGSKKLLLVYILGGLIGAAFYIAAYNLFPAFVKDVPISIAMGASASVMAIIIAIAAYIPDYTVRLFLVGQIKFKWIAVIFVIIDLLSIKEKDNSGGHFAHLGGAFFGFTYILLLKKSIIVKQLFNPLSKLFKRKPKVKATYSIPHVRDKNDDDFRYKRKVHEQRIDEILDKIKISGYESLSKDDKEYLFKASKNQ